MNKYPKYKSSGIKWIGEIPEYWNEIKLKYIGFLYSGLSGKSGDDFKQIDNPFNKPYIPFTNIANNIKIDPTQLDNVVIKEDDNQNQVKQNDLFFMMSSENFDDVGKATILLHNLGEVYLNSFCRGFRVVDKNVYPLFLNFLLLNDAYRRKMMIEANGFTRINLKMEKVNDFLVELPPLNEQIAIAKFLDDKTVQIDKLITNKQKLIELLKEERTTIINHAVTRGINPNVKLKPSGIEWLGNIPEHWEVKNLKYVMDSFDNLRVPVSADQRNGEKIYDYYGASGVIDKVSNYLFDGEFILIGEDGANLFTRSTALAFKAIGKFWVNNHAHILKPKFGNIDFYTYLLESIDYSIWVTGSAQPKLTAENLMNIKIWFPGGEEQNQIVKHIETETNRTDNTISKIEIEIELLQEYRTALISEVVTGKIDVRNTV